MNYYHYYHRTEQCAYHAVYASQVFTVLLALAWSPTIEILIPAVTGWLSSKLQLSIVLIIGYSAVCFSNLSIVWYIESQK